jgi:hypothetical protein
MPYRICSVAILLATLNLYSSSKYVSQFWPQFIETNEAIQLDTANTIPQNQRAVFIRYDHSKQKILVDFGRHGVHLIEPEKTNFKQIYNSYQDGTLKKDVPNLTAMLTPRLVTYDQAYKTIGFNSFRDIESYLIIFLNKQIHTIKKLKSLEKRIVNYEKQNPQARVLVFPSTPDHYYYASKKRLGLKFINPGVSKAYKKTLDIPPFEAKAKYHLFQFDSNGSILNEEINCSSWNTLISKLK